MLNQPVDFSLFTSHFEKNNDKNIDQQIFVRKNKNLQNFRNKKKENKIRKVSEGNKDSVRSKRVFLEVVLFVALNRLLKKTSDLMRKFLKLMKNLGFFEIL